MERLTEQEIKDVQMFLATLFGNQALKWNINLKVLEMFGELLQSSESCRRYMNMVPRPFFAGSIIKWANKQARQAVIRHIKNGGKHYLICLKATAVSRKHAFYLASMGL